MHLRLRLLFLSLLAGASTAAMCHAAEFTVTTTADSGAGSLRQAILDANDNAGPDTVRFQISGAGTRTITPLTALPPVLNPVALDGSTQPGYVDRPIIEINGSSAGANAGLRILSGSSVVRGLCINRFAADGIRLEGPGGNFVQGNFIGTDALGFLARGNGAEGVLVFNSWGNTIGGTNNLDRNIICANGDAGVYLLNAGSNVVAGNSIGLGASGFSAIPNGNNGIIMYQSRSNLLGGSESGARNVVSGNKGSGIYLFGAGAVGNSIQGNYIGVNALGTAGLSNSADGITISGSPSNTIGGAISGAGNLVSGNGGAGVFLSGSGAKGNSVLGNFIGLGVRGTNAIGNAFAGVTLLGAVSNMIGGDTWTGANVISGNRQDGIFFATNSAGNTVAGNRIGTDLSGRFALGNGMNGIALNGARGNMIGDAGSSITDAINLISGNGMHGVSFSNQATGNVVAGNFIGTDASGAVALGNSNSGVRLDAGGNRIGGFGGLGGNLISGNLLDGIQVVGASAGSNIVQANRIGVSRFGTNALGNGRAGIGIADSPGNLIGGSAPGLGNTITGNKEAGIYLYLAGACYNQVQGNLIGTTPEGLLLGNKWEGIYIGLARSNLIGGASVGAGNYIGGNQTRGVWLSGATDNAVQGNRIRGNVFHGVEMSDGARNNVIGGDEAGMNQLTEAQNVYTGVRVRDGCTNNAVLGNSIFGNGALGIDLGTAGPMINDDCDLDTGANQGQNYPELAAAYQTVPGLTVQGRLRGAAGQQYTIRFFADINADPTGYGEGRHYLGKSIVVASQNCERQFTAHVPARLNALDFYPQQVSATATDSNGNTSEFSLSIRASLPPALKAELRQTPNGPVFVASWPVAQASFELLHTPSLLPPVPWTVVTNSVRAENGLMLVELVPSGTNAFYALRPK